MNDNKNMLLAVVLSMLVLLGWSFVAEHFFPTPEEKPAAAAPSVAAGGNLPGPALGGPVGALRPRTAVLAETPRLRIETPALVGSVNLKGARLDDLTLIRHRETVKKDSAKIRLFSPSGANAAYFAQFGWTGSGAAVVPGPDTVWQASGPVLAPGKPVTLSWNNTQGQRFEIALAVDENYMFTATQRVVNGGGQALVLRPYAVLARDGHSKDPDSWTAHVGATGVFDDRLTDVDYEEVDEAPDNRLTFNSTGGWTGFADTYWLAALIPAQDVKVDAAMRRTGSSRYQIDLAAEAQIVAPAAMAANTVRLFAGAKEVQVLDGYKSRFDIPQFDKAIDWGWFYFLTKPIFYLLDWLFRLLGNFGVAIIGLTIIVRLIMFPVANKQFSSMARMRVVQPRMKELQERYKDDRVRLQQEMMALYSKEKINPLAGCLPILLQIPVFYALYKVLLLTIEMRHQPFVLWIKDLSAPDPLTPVNLFGLLPFTPPPMIGLGVLAILLGITMWLQQKLNPQPMDEVQQKVFALMPWVFMFIMAPFAAGLQLYWVTNNIISIIQQGYFLKRHPMPAEAAKAK